MECNRRVSSYYESDDGSWESEPTSAHLRPAPAAKPPGSSASMQRVLAGLKGFGIKGSHPPSSCQSFKVPLP